MTEPRLHVVRSEPQDALPSTFQELFLGYSSYVAAIGVRLLGRADDVDDLVQDVFLAAFSGLKHLRHAQALKAWLASVTVRLARKRLRLYRLQSFFGFDPQAAHLDIADSAASPADRALLAQVYRLMDRLPVDDRVAWTLRHVEGLQLEEVAELCGCSLATAKRRILAAQVRLDREMDHG